MDDDAKDMFDDFMAEGGGEAEPGSDAGEDAGSDAPPADESKRVNDLMSQAQKAESRANKLQKRLDQMEAAQKDRQPEGDAQPEPRDAEREEWIAAQREFLRERALGLDSRLEEYGVTLDDITGDTPTAIKASVKRYRDLIDAVETKARTRLLLEYGLNPEIAGQAADPKVDIGGMDDKAFEALVAKTRGY